MLEVIHLEKRFWLHRLKREVTAFSGVNLRLEPGEFVLLEGANGAGKSSLLRCLYRTYRPTGGEAWLRTPRGRWDLARLGDREVLWVRQNVMGYVSQFLDPRPRTTAVDIVAEPLLWQGLDEDQARRKAASLLLDLGLRPEFLNAFPYGFSGGERQKVNLARALIRDYRLLLLDEPTASLDAEARKALRQRLEDLKRAGTAILAVFHHPEDVEGLVDRTYSLEAAEYVDLRSEAGSP